MLFALAAPALSYSAPNGKGPDRGGSPATLTRLGTVKATGAEIVAYDSRSEHLFTTAATDQVVDVIDASSPSRLSVID